MAYLRRERMKESITVDEFIKLLEDHTQLLRKIGNSEQWIVAGYPDINSGQYKVSFDPA